MSSQTIMVIEDDIDIVESLGFIFTDAGYDIVAAEDGRAAMEYLHSHPAPGLILLDLMMPGMNGFDFRDAVAADPALAAIPMVVMTASRGHEDTFKWPAVAWLRKPFHFEELMGTVRRCLEPSTAA